jgi:hypothetical protein
MSGRWNDGGRVLKSVKDKMMDSDRVASLRLRRGERFSRKGGKKVVCVSYVSEFDQNDGLVRRNVTNYPA